MVIISPHPRTFQRLNKTVIAPIFLESSSLKRKRCSTTIILIDYHFKYTVNPSSIAKKSNDYYVMTISHCFYQWCAKIRCYQHSKIKHRVTVFIFYAVHCNRIPRYAVAGREIVANYHACMHYSGSRIAAPTIDAVAVKCMQGRCAYNFDIYKCMF